MAFFRTTLHPKKMNGFKSNFVANIKNKAGKNAEFHFAVLHKYIHKINHVVLFLLSNNFVKSLGL